MLKVLNGGVYSSIQDLGRLYFGGVGVPVSGAMDHYSTKLSNLLIGNNKNDAVLEVTNHGSSFQFLKETIICITGADLGCELNNKPISPNHPVKVTAQSILKFTKRSYGIRAYIAVKGGFLNKEVLGSRSFFKEITKKYLLKKDDEILYEEYKTTKGKHFSSVKVNKNYFDSSSIEVYKGPEYDLLNNTQKTFLKSKTFTITKNNNRMGYKLNERLLNSLDSMLTSAMLPGTVQLTPSGKLIILMRDCGVTGGYPRVLQLIDDAINRIAQKTTNDAIQFKLVDLPK